MRLAELNSNELMIGAIFGMTFMFTFGFFVVPVALAVSLLWALGGRYGHSIRVFGVPAVICLADIFLSNNYWGLFSYAPAAGVLSCGYGIHSTQPPDEGSALGRFWYRISPKYADFLTRGTIYLLLVIAFLPVYF